MRRIEALLGCGDFCRNSLVLSFVKTEFRALSQYFDAIRKMFRGDLACPWIKSQNHESLLPYFKEELGEFIQALRDHEEAKDLRRPIDELGDLWQQCVLHLLILSERSGKSLEAIFDSWRVKIEERHPHVFAAIPGEKISLEEVVAGWKVRKNAERVNESSTAEIRKTESFLELGATLSELVRAQKIGERSRAFNFDWANANEVREKIEEELAELDQALIIRDEKALREEIGDLLFSVVQLSRHCEISAEEALSAANNKFIARFSKVEEIFESENPRLARGDWMKVPRGELEKLWARAKNLLR